MRLRLWVHLPLIASLSCGGDNRAALVFDADEAVQLTLDEVLVIGEVEGDDPAYLLDRVRHVKLTEDLVVVVAGRADISLFDRRGRFLRHLAREGDGPRELRRVGAISIGENDEIVIYDRGRSRVVTFAPDGSPKGQYNVSRGVGISTGSGVALVSGDFFAPRRHVEKGVGRDPVLEQDTVPLLRFRPNGSVDSIRRIPSPPVLVVRRPQPSLLSAPLRKGPTIAAWRSGLAYVDGVSSIIELWDSRGRTVRTIRTGHEPVRVEPSIIDSWVEARRARLAEMPTRPPGVSDDDVMFPFGVEPPWPDHLPVYDQIRGGQGECILVGMYSAPGQT